MSRDAIALNEANRVCKAYTSKGFAGLTKVKQCSFRAQCRWKGIRKVLQKYSVKTDSGKLELLLHDRIRSISQRLFFLAQTYNGTILPGDAGGNRTESCEST